MTAVGFHSLLPIAAQKALREAAAIDPKVGRTESRYRTLALENLLGRLRLFNPERFQPEEK